MSNKKNAIIALIISFSTSFVEASSIYVRGQMGLPIYRKFAGQFSDTPTFKPTGDIGLGVQAFKYAGVELSAGYMKYNSVQSLHGLVNLYVYTNTFDSKRVIYFLKSGVGYSSNSLENNRVTSFAWQMGVGFEYNINNKAIVGDIKWLNLGSFKRVGQTAKLRNLVLELGLKYRF